MSNPDAVEPDEREESSNSESSDSDSSGDEEPQVEWLVSTREKRSTAGNRLTSLLQQEDENDELELLFAEGDEDDDEEFDDPTANDSDVQMDSSDDDDDQGPSAAVDDLDGEKELQQQERAKQRKKRKANDHLPKAFQKRQRYNEDESNAPVAIPRPKKKSERTSWLPLPGDAPTRLSGRAATRTQREELRKQLVVREEYRLRQQEIMERANAKREANKPKQMTQEDRLAEAARVEKRNAKSLNKWEEAEKQREEEQRAKLAALHNRKLEGPVVSLLSCRNTYEDGRLKMVGKNSIAAKPGFVYKRKKVEEVMDETVESSRRGSTHTESAFSTKAASVVGTKESTPIPDSAIPLQHPSTIHAASTKQGIPDLSLSKEPQESATTGPDSVSVGQQNEVDKHTEQIQTSNPSDAEPVTKPVESAAMELDTPNVPVPIAPKVEDIPPTDKHISPEPTAPQLQQPQALVPDAFIEYSMASRVQLVNFKDITAKDKQDFYSMILFGRDASYFAKTAKPHSLSSILNT